LALLRPLFGLGGSTAERLAAPDRQDFRFVLRLRPQAIVVLHGCSNRTIIA
jgi:hypothetical protein